MPVAAQIEPASERMRAEAWRFTACWLRGRAANEQHDTPHS